jgi:glycosyltransferase involved in cell wall biosynthesis
MKKSEEKLAIVIPTFRRVSTLRCLLSDLLHQTVMPDALVIVDGDPDSGEAIRMLMQYQFPFGLTVKYISSNHGNAPYQRYLGAEIARGHQWVIFFDDDIRMNDIDVIEKMIAPFTWKDRCVVGVSPCIEFPSREYVHREYKGSYPPGSITPVGDRVPIVDNEADYLSVATLRGGCMAYCLKDLLAVMFSEDAFAMSHIRCGLGVDDTFLSRQVSQFGELIYAACARVIHPDSDMPQAYPARGYKLAYARAFSRRFINDNYRIKQHPTLSDRLFLIKYLVGHIGLGFWCAFRTMDKSRFAYAWGYLIGAIRAFIQKPTAKNLTPYINWRIDAEQALVKMVLIQ